MRRLVAINFLESFIASAIAVLIPLLLLSRNVEVSEIGLVLSALPLIFLFARLLFAAVADQSGFRNFFVFAWLAQFASILIYFFAATPIGFLFGKVTEGLRASAFWAVNRTAIFYYSEGREARAAAKISVFRTAGAAVGTAIAGAVAAFSGLHYALIMLAGATLLQGLPTLTMKPYPNPKFSVRKTVSLLMPFKKSREFWLASVCLGLYALALYPIFNLIAPVYMRLDLSMGYDAIGYVIAAYYLINTLATWAAMRLRLSFKGGAFLQVLIFGAGCLMIALNGSGLFVPLFLMLAIGDGLSFVSYEAVIAKITKGKPSVSTDIGFLHVPYRLAEFGSIIFAGFAFQYLGYPVVFAISALSFAAYSFLAWRILR